MHYLITYDKENYTKLPSVTFSDDGYDVFKIPGGGQTQRKRPDTFSFSFNGILPDGTEAIILDPLGKVHFVLFTKTNISNGGMHCGGIVTETTTPDKNQIDQIFAKNA